MFRWYWSLDIGLKNYVSFPSFLSTYLQTFFASMHTDTVTLWFRSVPQRLWCIRVKGKGKTIPLQATTDPEGSRSLRLPDFKTNGWTCRVVRVLPHTKVCEYNLYKTLLMMDRWGLKHVELTQVLNKTYLLRPYCVSCWTTYTLEGGKVVSCTHRQPLPPGNILGTHFC